MLKKFIKMHGLGNDFAVFDARDDGWLPEPGCVAALSDRNCGIGFDQLIVMGKSGESASVDAYMYIYNGDGSIVGACGNASRCIAQLLINELKKESVTIETKAGFLKAVREVDKIKLDMGLPRLNWRDIPLAQEMDTLHVAISAELPDAAVVNMGNPHAVFFMPGETDVAQWGGQVETHSLFPERANVEFVKVIDRRTLRMKVWERGAGITKACGTGACASVVAAVRRGLTDRKVTVILDGGTLDIEWRESDNHVLMTGPAMEVYRGEIEI